MTVLFKPRMNSLFKEAAHLRLVQCVEPTAGSWPVSLSAFSVTHNPHDCWLNFLKHREAYHSPLPNPSGALQAWDPTSSFGLDSYSCPSHPINATLNIPNFSALCAHSKESQASGTLVLFPACLLPPCLPEHSHTVPMMLLFFIAFPASSIIRFPLCQLLGHFYISEFLHMHWHPHKNKTT